MTAGLTMPQSDALKFPRRQRTISAARNLGWRFKRAHRVVILGVRAVAGPQRRHLQAEVQFNSQQPMLSEVLRAENGSRSVPALFSRSTCERLAATFRS